MLADDVRTVARQQDCWNCNSTEPTEEERLASVFNRLDQNSDGVLSRGSSRKLQGNFKETFTQQVFCIGLGLCALVVLAAGSEISM